MKRIILTISLALAGAVSTFAWDAVGHKTVALIAEQNLTPSARANIEKYLGGQSLGDVASWCDKARHKPTYRFTHVWHTNNVDWNYHHMAPNDPYVETLIKHCNESANYGDRIPEDYALYGDGTQALINFKDVLKNYRELDDSTVNVHIKYITHIVGDMHCPGHIHYCDIWYRAKVRYEGDNPKYMDFPQKINQVAEGEQGWLCNFHVYWDKFVFSFVTPEWTAEDYAAKLGKASARQKAKLAAGGPEDWLEDAIQMAVGSWEWAKYPATDVMPENLRVDDKALEKMLSRDRRIAEKLLQKAGLRLAAYLNEVFSEE